MLSDNSLPVSENDDVTTSEDTSIQITLVASDVNNDPLSFALQSDTQNGELSLDGNVATYMPSENFNGNDNFTFNASDAEAINTATVDITVTPVNDALIIGSTPAAQAIGTRYRFAPESSDVDGDALTFSTENLPDWLTLNTITGEVSGTPEAVVRRILC